ncbi:MAG: hypothetical protein HW402_80 [Dehalococcoidales bacterium]|nr:hypothetical protein [Dehalococcoidales bacterium]
MARRFYYGGQAVIEGVMMRGQKNMVIAVRRPDGELAITTERLGNLYTGWLRRTPLTRGIIILLEAMVLGIQSVMYSANVSLEEEGEQVSGGMIWAIVALAVVFAVALFFMVPLFLTRLFHLSSPLLFNLVDGLIRVAIFTAYLKTMTLVPDLRRVFAYHGAEHKAVNAYEDDAPLELETASQYSTAHARCGTSFLFVVLIISIILFALVGLPSLWLMILSRIVFIPVIAAISYEVIYFGARHTNIGLIRALLLPGQWLQKLTTREPDARQLEVALSALKGVVEADELAAQAVAAE